MKKLKINLFAVIIGLGLALVGTSAFRSNLEPTHGLSGSSWIPLDGLTEVSTTPSSGQYRCNIPQNNEVCKAYFAPEDENFENPMNEVTGIFEYVP